MGPIYTIVLFCIGACLAAEEAYITGSSKIVSDIEYRPWQGSISKGFKFVCGCVLISYNRAVTAASCVQSPPYDVRFGSVKRTEGTMRAVEEIIIHANYSTSGSYKYNDIAVLKFAPLELSFTINSIPLADQWSINADCYFTGWGTSDTADFQLYLREGRIRTAESSECKRVWPYTDGSHICTLDSASTCRGDTGGPLACAKNGELKLVGISSWQSLSCNSYGNPVYTSVSYFRQWIEETTGI